jgi:hypothetical protein
MKTKNQPTKTKKNKSNKTKDETKLFKFRVVETSYYSLDVVAESENDAIEIFKDNRSKAEENSDWEFEAYELEQDPVNLPQGTILD